VSPGGRIDSSRAKVDNSRAVNDGPSGRKRVSSDPFNDRLADRWIFKVGAYRGLPSRARDCLFIDLAMIAATGMKSVLIQRSYRRRKARHKSRSRCVDSASRRDSFAHLDTLALYFRKHPSGLAVLPCPTQSDPLPPWAPQVARHRDRGGSAGLFVTLMRVPDGPQCSRLFS